MKVIITGGTGIIGQALTHELVNHDHEVVILTRFPKNHSPSHEKVKVVGWDTKTASGWLEYAEGADALVNLAGESLRGENLLRMVFTDRWTPEKKDRILRSRLDAGAAVVDAIRRARIKPKVVLQSSAVGYYGPHANEPLTEASPPGDDYLARVCIEWENSTAPVEEMGVRRAMIRTGIILAMEGGPLPFMMLPFHFFAGGPLGSGKQIYSWIHIADEVAAIRFLLENEQAQGPYNLAAPNPLSNAELSQALGRVMQRPYYLPVPGIFFKLAFGEVSTVILDGQKTVPDKLLQQGFQFRFPEAEGALRNIIGP